MKTIEVELDGRVNGIEVWYKDSVIKNKEGKPRMFLSCEAARNYMGSIIKEPNASNYDMCIKLNTKTIQFGEVGIENGKYIAYKNLEQGIFTKYIITPNTRKIICSEGYIIFPGEENLDKKSGRAKYSKLYDIVRESLGNIVSENKNASYIKRNNGEIELCFYNSSLSLHILGVHQLMRINQERKAKGNRCIPFEKTDMYSSIFMYYSTFPAESKYKNMKLVEETNQKIKSNIFQVSGIDPELTNVLFDGIIWE